MSELVRSVVSRFSRFIVDRRGEPRVSVRLPFSISIQGTNGNGNGGRERLLEGHTRDVSAGGLGLIVNTVRIDGRHQAIPAGPFRWNEKPVVEVPEESERDVQILGTDPREAPHLRRKLPGNRPEVVRPVGRDHQRDEGPRHLRERASWRRARSRA